jgi:hypothetical protein
VDTEDSSQDAAQRPQAPGLLSQLLRGSLVTQLIHVAATLGVADLLSDGPKSATGSPRRLGSIGRRCTGCCEPSRASASSRRPIPTGFALTTLAQPLRSYVRGSLRASAMWYGEPWWWLACGDLRHSVRMGQPGFDHENGKPLFAYLDDAADAAAIFNRHQANMTCRMRQRRSARTASRSGQRSLPWQADGCHHAPRHPRA